MTPRNVGHRRRSPYPTRSVGASASDGRAGGSGQPADDPECDIGVTSGDNPEYRAVGFGRPPLWTPAKPRTETRGWAHEGATRQQQRLATTRPARVGPAGSSFSWPHKSVPGAGAAHRLAGLGSPLLGVGVVRARPTPTRRVQRGALGADAGASCWPTRTDSCGSSPPPTSPHSAISHPPQSPDAVTRAASPGRVISAGDVRAGQRGVTVGWPPRLLRVGK